MHSEKNKLLPYVAVDPHVTPEILAIWMHGLGADGNDLAGVVSELHLPQDLPIKFIFPHAPMRPITINNGCMMRAWYDIKRIGILPLEEDEIGIRESERAICALIEYEREQLGIASDKVLLAGFSQGGAMALHVGARYTEPLAGVIALSAYVPLSDKFLPESQAANKQIPIFMAHGEQDPLIPLTFAHTSCKFLLHNHYQVEWHTYPMAHSICMDEINDISKWIKDLFYA